MKFGLVIYGDLGTKTGGYLYDLMLVKGLNDRGHNVRIISLTRRPHVDNLENNSDTELERLLTNLDVDILLEDELCHPSLCHMNPLIKDYVSYDIVAIVHGLSRSLTRSKRERKMIDNLERSFLSSVDSFIFNSKSTKAETDALLGHSSKGVVAYPGKDHFSRTLPLEKDFNDSLLKLIYVANITSYKGLDVLIEGLSGLSDFFLIVIGEIVDQSFFNHVQQLIKERDFESRVEFLGPQSGERLHQRLDASHIFVLPSYYEGFGIAYIEALGHGLPVIATNSGGIKKVISDGREGFLVPPDSPEIIGRCLREMQKDRRILRQMSKAAFDRYESLPTWDQSVEKIHAFLLSLES